MARQRTSMPIPWDWNGEAWKCWAIEWPDSPVWNAILNGFITTPERGWFWDERTGDLMAAIATGKEIALRNERQEEVLMTCNEATTELFERMAIALEALAERECCSTAGTGIINSGSRGSGVMEQPPDNYDEGDSPETPPNGFPSWAAYREHKCNAAHDLIKNLKVDLLSLSNLLPDLSGATWTAILTGVLAVLLTPIPFDDLALLVSTLIVGAFAYSFLAQLSSEIEDNAQNLVCTLYTSPDAEAGKSNLIQELEGIIDGMSVDPENVKDWLKSIVGPMVTYDAVNRIFNPGPTEEQDGDCSSCGGDTLWQLEPAGGVMPTLVSGNLATGGVVGSGYADFFGGFRNFLTIATTTHPENRYMRIASIPLSTSNVVTCDIYISDVLDETFFAVDIDTLVGLERTCSSVHIRSEVAGVDDDFEVEFDFTP